ncbi:hypothetical protein DL771_005685 [Monosporascus sp. 5C6A]|nr:hypothetical protein DL771_005685 [Monosporascus sp. 5C6A]
MNGKAHEVVDLVALGDNIAVQTKRISEYFNANNIAAPTFAANSSEPPETAEYVAMYNSLKSSLDDLGRLVDGPRRWLRSFVCQANDLAAFQVAFELDFFSLVPPQGDISLEDLVDKVALDAD